jgi:serine/threonine-protein kinase
LVGRRLEGRYRLLERIARGGMSTVYAAVDERLDRLVAVKVMAAALSADPAFSDRFAREARAAARLTHLNVVSVYDQGNEIAPDGHHVFLVMELVEGRTLRELLRERGRLSPAEAVSIMEPVLSALSAAHHAGLVHRDVKPENILLSDDGVVKVADFGLARAVESDASSTRTGLMMGTVAYCAPEQISRGESDPRSDVYSAGVVLFELLTGAPPYRGDSAISVAYQHVHSRVPAPSSRVKGTPTELDELVVAATDSDPTGRPADAGAFLAEIADVRQQLALPVVPVPPRERPRSRAELRDGRNRTPDRTTTDLIRGRAAGQDTTALPRRPAGAGAPGNGRAPYRDEPAPPPVVIPPPKPGRERSPERRRRRRAIIVTVIILLLGVGAFFGARAFIEWRFAHVPNVIGATESDAVQKLHDAGYHVTIGQAFDETVPKGHVINTDPDADARLTKGDTVSVVVSSGKRHYTIPNVKGEDPDTARQRLLDIGPDGDINVLQQLSHEYSDCTKASCVVPENEVIRTSPPAGTAVTSGQPITIYVSQGAPYVDVPAVANTSLHDAKKALQHADLRFTTQEQYSDDVDPGKVIDASPNDRARKFSEVTLSVSKGPEFVTVPTFDRLEDISTVQSQLSALGLFIDVQRPFGGPGDHLLNCPASGQQVRPGTTITVNAI